MQMFPAISAPSSGIGTPTKLIADGLPIPDHPIGIDFETFVYGPLEARESIVECVECRKHDVPFATDVGRQTELDSRDDGSVANSTAEISLPVVVGDVAAAELVGANSQSVDQSSALTVGVAAVPDPSITTALTWNSSVSDSVPDMTQTDEAVDTSTSQIELAVDAIAVDAIQTPIQPKVDAQNYQSLSGDVGLAVSQHETDPMSPPEQAFGEQSGRTGGSTLRDLYLPFKVYRREIREASREVVDHTRPIKERSDAVPAEHGGKATDNFRCGNCASLAPAFTPQQTPVAANVSERGNDYRSIPVSTDSREIEKPPTSGTVVDDHGKAIGPEFVEQAAENTLARSDTNQPSATETVPRPGPTVSNQPATAIHRQTASPIRPEIDPVSQWTVHREQSPAPVYMSDAYIETAVSTSEQPASVRTRPVSQTSAVIDHQAADRPTLPDSVNSPTSVAPQNSAPTESTVELQGLSGAQEANVRVYMPDGGGGLRVHPAHGLPVRDDADSIPGQSRDNQSEPAVPEVTTTTVSPDKAVVQSQTSTATAAAVPRVPQQTPTRSNLELAADRRSFDPVSRRATEESTPVRIPELPRTDSIPVDRQTTQELPHNIDLAIQPVIASAVAGAAISSQTAEEDLPPVASATNESPLTSVAPDFRLPATGEKVSSETLVVDSIKAPIASLAAEAQEAIITRARRLDVNDAAEIEIEIDPPELGRLNIRLTRINGEVSARITATEPGTLELLQNELQDLRDSLAQSGVALSRVDFEQHGQRPSRQHYLEANTDASQPETDESSKSDGTQRNNDNNRTIDVRI